MQVFFVWIMFALKKLESSLFVVVFLLVDDWFAVLSFQELEVMGGYLRPADEQRKI